MKYLENSTDEVSSEATSNQPKPTNPARKIIPFVIALVVLAGVFYLATQWNKNHRPSSDYNLSEIDNLQAEEQKRILEDQLGEYQRRAAELASDASVSDKYTVYIKLAELQNRLEKYQDAISSVDKIAKENEGNTRIWTTYATSYKGLGDNQKALSSVNEALGIDKEIPDAWRMKIDLSQSADAATLNGLYTEALKYTKNDIEIVKSYARFLEKTGDTAKAVIYWETARNIDPSHATDYEKEITRLRPPQ